MNKAVGHIYLLRTKTVHCWQLCTKGIKGPKSSKMNMLHLAISATIDGGKVSRSVRTLSNIYFLKFERCFLGETKLYDINISLESKLYIVDTYLDIENQDLHYIDIINWDPFLYIIFHHTKDSWINPQWKSPPPMETSQVDYSSLYAIHLQPWVECNKFSWWGREHCASSDVWVRECLSLQWVWPALDINFF